MIPASYRFVLLALVLIAGMLPAHRTAADWSAAQGRPSLSGEAFTHGTEHFVIHYTFIGVDAVPSADQDENSVPDWVEDVGDAMETIWRVEVDRLNWPAPLPDRGEGGDTRFDVYLMELFSKNLGGYVSPDGGFVGDNPNTPRREQAAAYGYMVLDNDYIDPNPPAGLKVWPPSDWLRIIAAHEFNHMLQISITGVHSMHWWYEATANWMETQVFPDLPDNVRSAGAVFKSPDTCIMRYGGVDRVESGLHWYGMWVFNQLLSETYGPGMVLDIWYRMGDSGGYIPFDEAFAAHDSTFEDVMRQFAVAVLLRDFSGGSRYPTPRLQESVETPGEWTPVDGVQRYAMDYIGLELDGGTHTITVDSADQGIEGIVVGVDGLSADVFPAGREVTVDFDGYDHAYLIVLNLTRPPNEAGCATARYTYAVKEAVGESTARAYDTGAAHFAEPRVEAVTDPEDIAIFNPFYQTEYNIREEIKEVDVPFNPIVPHGAPPGYELDSVYGVDADEVGEGFVALNAPSGGVVVQMLYYNDEGQMIRITESPAIYRTVGEWLAVNRLESQPGTQVWTSGSVDTAIVGTGPHLVTFFVRERFMAIDGDADLEDKLDMAARFSTSFK